MLRFAAGGLAELVGVLANAVAASAAPGAPAAALAGLSGTVTVTFSASGHTGTDQASQSLMANVTFVNGVASGSTSGSFMYSRLTSCGTNTTAGSGESTDTSASLDALSASSYRVAVGVGATMTVTRSEQDQFHDCAHTTSTYQGGLSLGVVTGVGSGDPSTAMDLAGTTTKALGSGCVGAQPGPEFVAFPNDACTLTITWSLHRVCDTTLLRKAEGEFNRADILFGQGDTTLYAADQKAREWTVDETKEFAKIAVVKGGLLFGLKQLSHKAAEFIEYGLGSVLQAYWIASDVEPEILDHDNAVKESRMLYDEGARTARQGVADLEQELKQEPACQALAQDARKKEDLARKKLDLIDSWENNGVLYWSPTRHEWESEAAALKEADGILTGGHALEAAGPQRFARKPRRVRLTKAQIEAALPLLDKALRLHHRADAYWRRSTKASETFVSKMRALLAQG